MKVCKMVAGFLMTAFFFLPGSAIAADYVPHQKINLSFGVWEIEPSSNGFPLYETFFSVPPRVVPVKGILKDNPHQITSALKSFGQAKLMNQCCALLNSMQQWPVKAIHNDGSSVIGFSYIVTPMVNQQNKSVTIKCISHIPEKISFPEITLMPGESVVYLPGDIRKAAVKSASTVRVIAITFDTLETTK